MECQFYAAAQRISRHLFRMWICDISCLFVFLCSLIILSFSSICKTKNFGDFVFGAVTLSVFVAYCVNSFSIFQVPESKAWPGLVFCLQSYSISYQERMENRGKSISRGAFASFHVGVFVVIGFLRFESEKILSISKRQETEAIGKRWRNLLLNRFRYSTRLIQAECQCIGTWEKPRIIWAKNVGW